MLKTDGFQINPPKVSNYHEYPSKWDIYHIIIILQNKNPLASQQNMEIPNKVYCFPQCQPNKLKNNMRDPLTSDTSWQILFVVLLIYAGIPDYKAKPLISQTMTMHQEVEKLTGCFL